MVYKIDENKLFKAFAEARCDDLRLYNQIKEIMAEEVKVAEGKTAAKQYDILVGLINSENNAGWEGRHSERISMLREALSEISEKYEEHLH